MDSDGFLCDLCSEIFDVEGDLIEHMFDDHDITNYVPTDYLMDNENSPESLIYIDDDDTNEDSESGRSDTDIQDADEEDIVIDLTTNNNNDDINGIKGNPVTSSSNPSPADGNDDIPSHLQNSSITEQEQGEVPVRRKRGRPPLPKQTYVCEHCDYKTMVKAVMKNHRLTHTLDCPYCPFKTIRENCLTEHIRTEHLDENGARRSVWMEDSGGCSWTQKNFLMAILANKNATLGFPVSPRSFSYLSQCLRQTIIRNTKSVEIAQTAFNFLNKMGLVDIKNNDVNCN